MCSYGNVICKTIVMENFDSKLILLKYPRKEDTIIYNTIIKIKVILYAEKNEILFLKGIFKLVKQIFGNIEN